MVEIALTLGLIMGITAVAGITLTLLLIALGRVKV